MMVFIRCMYEKMLNVCQYHHQGDNLRTRLDFSDDGVNEEAVEDAGTPRTAEEKAQLQFHLVESFGSEKQKRLLANARRSKVDVKDLDSSISNSLPAVDSQCKIIFRRM